MEWKLGNTETAITAPTPLVVANSQQMVIIRHPRHRTGVRTDAFFSLFLGEHVHVFTLVFFVKLRVVWFFSAGCARLECGGS
jgi:hypothetical protein